MTQMIKRIPVTEARWKQLGNIKQAGETYDKLLEKMIQAHNKQELAKKAARAKRGEEELYELEDI